MKIRIKLKINSKISHFFDRKLHYTPSQKEYLLYAYYKARSSTSFYQRRCCGLKTTIIFPSFSARGSEFLQNIGIFWLIIRFFNCFPWKRSPSLGNLNLAPINASQISSWKFQKVCIHAKRSSFSSCSSFSRKRFFPWMIKICPCERKIVQSPSSRKPSSPAPNHCWRESSSHLMSGILSWINKSPNRERFVLIHIGALRS